MDLHATYINLPHRTDRNERMKAELSKSGIEANRIDGMLPSEVDVPSHKTMVMQNRTPGAIGCHYSQVRCMSAALNVDKHALVMEDDLVFCSDFQERLAYIDKFCQTHEWDVIWLGATFHVPAQWHRNVNGFHTHPDLKMCRCDVGKDVRTTDDPRMVQTFGCWSTYAYIVNKDSIAKILQMLDENVSISMGIDWLFILLQPQLKTFSFVPGCVKQYDNQSDIGKGVTVFSAFANLGPYWWADRMTDFNPQSFNFNR